MFRVACCVLFASLCLPIIAQDAPQTEQDTVEVWIVGASDRVIRVDPADGAAEVDGRRIAAEGEPRRVGLQLEAGEHRLALRV